MINVLVKNKNQTIGFPDTMSADEINSVVSEHVNGTISTGKPPGFYETSVQPILDKIGFKNVFSSNDQLTPTNIFFKINDRMMNEFNSGVVKGFTGIDTYEPRTLDDKTDLDHIFQGAGNIVGMMAGIYGVGTGLSATTRLPAVAEQAAVAVTKANIPFISERAMRFIPRLIGTGAAVGGYEAITQTGEETQNAIQGEGFNAEKIGETLVSGTAFGAAWGGVSGVAGFKAAVGSAFGLGYLNERVQGHSHNDGLLGGTALAALEALTRGGADLKFRKETIQNIKGSLRDWAMIKNPKISKGMADNLAEAKIKKEADAMGGMEKVLESPENSIAFLERLNARIRQSTPKQEKIAVEGPIGTGEPVVVSGKAIEQNIVRDESGKPIEIGKVGEDPQQRYIDGKLHELQSDGTFKNIEPPEPKIKLGVKTLYQGKGKPKSDIYAQTQYPVAGKGSYYAIDSKAAENYGDKVTEHQVDTSNMLNISTDKEWNDLNKEAGNKYTNTTGMSEKDSIQWSENIKKAILAKGNNGLVVTINETGDVAKSLRNSFGHDQVIDYSPKEDVITEKQVNLIGEQTSAIVKPTKKQSAEDLLKKEDVTIENDYLKFSEPAKSPADLKRRIEQLNKFGMANAILRRGAKLKKAAGQFQGKKPRGNVKIAEETLADDAAYMSTLAHELGHALEFHVVGKTNHPRLKLFGDNLTDDQIRVLREELRAVTEDISPGGLKADPTYYDKNAELIARFFQKMFVSPGNLADMAPTALELIEQQAIKHPTISEFLEAVRGGIDAGVPKAVPMRDMRQVYQKHLGKRAGDRAFNTEMVHRAMKERGKIVIEKFIKDKFKGIKDSPENLFKAAESIRMSKGGIAEYGTRTFLTARSPQEESDFINYGYEKMPMPTFEEGVAYPQYAKWIYTPEQSKDIFDGLSDKGKKLILDFTAERQEAKDLFNREVIRDAYKVQGNIEGWVHHYFEDQPGGSTVLGGKKIKTKVAGARKQRTGKEGYVEDFKKAMTKALVDFEGERAYNAFVEKFLAQVTKPLAEGAAPEEGWIEVVGNIKTGVGLPIEKRTKIIDQATGKSVPISQSRYQMPKEIYERYKLWRGLIDEASIATRVINDINRYWRINILFHPGTAGTNYISGGVMYSAKILEDFYKETLTGNIKYEQTRNNVSALIKALIPKGWMEDSPDWIWGGDISNFYGQFGQKKSILGESVDTYANGALKLFSSVERYWKKVVSISENSSTLQNLSKVDKKGLAIPTEEEQKLLSEIVESLDMWTLDYDNVPAWLEAHQKSAIGQAVKPFAKYPYKYAKHIMDKVGNIFDQSVPWQDRMATLLMLTTIAGGFAVLANQKKEEQNTPVGDKSLDIPARYQTRGRLFTGTTDEDGKELFVRVSKYPYVGLSQAGLELVDGNFESSTDILSEMLGSIGPVGQMGLLALNFRNKYQQYTPVPVIIGDNLATFMPGSRILTEISRYNDPFQRKEETFSQAFTKMIPTTDEDLQEKIHGKIRTERVPIEEGVNDNLEADGRRTTVDIQLKNYKDDILLGALAGIYRSRIDPKNVEAFIIRKEKNLDKKKAKEEE